MISWISSNIGTLAVLAVVIVIAALIIIGICRDKKKGRSSCGNNCAHCQMAGQCHSAKGADLK